MPETSNKVGWLQAFPFLLLLQYYYFTVFSYLLFFLSFLRNFFLFWNKWRKPVKQILREAHCDRLQ